MERRLRLGMIGGGQGAFIGAVHRLSARMDDKYEFVAGCLSSTPEKAAISAEEIGLDPSRSYPDFKTMAEEESKRDDGIDLSATLYLPPGRKPSDGPLPLLVWAYPREFKTSKAASQVVGSAHRFFSINPASSSSSALIMLSYGGHGFKVLKDVKMIEVKQGPYSLSVDKVKFEKVNENKIKIK